MLDAFDGSLEDVGRSDFATANEVGQSEAVKVFILREGHRSQTVDVRPQ